MDMEPCISVIEPWNWIRLTVESVLTIVTIVGNIIVIVSILLVKILRKPKNYLLLSLAVADLLIGLLVLPFKIVQNIKCFVWIAKSMTCSALIPISVDILCCTASILGLTVIALDRYIAISRPLFYKVHVTTEKTIVIILVTWLASLACAAPYWGLHEIHRDLIGPYLLNICVTKQSNWARIILTTISFFVPLFVILVTYAKIWHVLRTRKQLKVVFGSGHQTSTNGRHEVIQKKSLSGSLVETLKETKGYTMLGIMLAFFAVCWLPFFSLILVVAVGEEIGQPLHPSPLAYELLVWLGYINSCINPFVYTMFDSHFRDAFTDILSFNYSRLNSRKRTTIVNGSNPINLPWSR